MGGRGRRAWGGGRVHSEKQLWPLPVLARPTTHAPRRSRALALTRSPAHGGGETGKGSAWSIYSLLRAAAAPPFKGKNKQRAQKNKSAAAGPSRPEPGPATPEAGYKNNRCARHSAPARLPESACLREDAAPKVKGCPGPTRPHVRPEAGLRALTAAGRTRQGGPEDGRPVPATLSRRGGRPAGGGVLMNKRPVRREAP